MAIVAFVLSLSTTVMLSIITYLLRYSEEWSTYMRHYEVAFGLFLLVIGEIVFVIVVLVLGVSESSSSSDDASDLSSGSDGIAYTVFALLSLALDFATLVYSRHSTGSFGVVVMFPNTRDNSLRSRRRMHMEDEGGNRLRRLCCIVPSPSGVTEVVRATCTRPGDEQGPGCHGNHRPRIAECELDFKDIADVNDAEPRTIAAVQLVRNRDGTLTQWASASTQSYAAAATGHKVYLGTIGDDRVTYVRTVAPAAKAHELQLDDDAD